MLVLPESFLISFVLLDLTINVEESLRENHTRLMIAITMHAAAVITDHDFI